MPKPRKLRPRRKPKPRKLLKRRNKKLRKQNRRRKNRLKRSPKQRKKPRIRRKKSLSERRLKWIRSARNVRLRRKLQHKNHQHPNPHLSLHPLRSLRKKRRSQYQYQHQLQHLPKHLRSKKKKQSLLRSQPSLVPHHRWTPLSSNRLSTTQSARSRIFARRRKRLTVVLIPMPSPTRPMKSSNVSRISLVTAAIRSRRSPSQHLCQLQLQNPNLRSKKSQKK